MSQFKFNIANAQYPADAFATVTVASTAGYLVGEQVSNGTVTADVSRIVDATRLVVDGVRGGVTMSGTLTGATSTTASLISAFAWGQPKMRDVNGVMTEMMMGVTTLDDKGFSTQVRSDTHKELSVAARLALSKIQNTDTTVVAILSYVLPADGTYGDGVALRFAIESNEALSVVGAPTLTFTDSALAPLVAAYNAAESTSMRLVFDYIVDVATTAGQIGAVTYAANGAVITDIGGAAITPVWSGDVTGILLA